MIKLGGKVFEGPTVLAGVRQGCPLSMLLFAIAIEPLLRLIEALIGNDGAAGAFADDIGIVIGSLRLYLPLLHVLFTRFAKASGLHLNRDKSIIVPLWDSRSSPAEAKCIVNGVVPGWNDFKCQLHAEYLGFILGPESVPRMWGSVLRKASDVVVKWRNLHV